MGNLLQAPLSQTTGEKNKPVVDSCDQANTRGGMSRYQSRVRGVEQSICFMKSREAGEEGRLCQEQVCEKKIHFLRMTWSIQRI